MGQIDSGLRAHEGLYAERIHRWQDQAIQRVGDQIVLDSMKGDTSNSVQRAGLDQSSRVLSNDLLNLRTKIANFGRAQLNEELKRSVVMVGGR